MKKCKLKGPCFARQSGNLCRILTECPEKRCAFQKPECLVTNGKLYPMDFNYDGHKKEKCK